jgi:RecB family exonuclease
MLATLAPSLQRDELNEERALFGELLAMPTEKLVLACTFAGLEKDRGETPSRFLLHALGVLRGGAEPSSKEIADGEGGVRKLALEQIWTADPASALDQDGRLLGSLNGGQRSGISSPDLRGVLTAARPGMVPALALEAARAEQPGRSAFDGELGPETTAALAARGLFRGTAPGPNGAGPLSVSRLEGYAACGMQSFLRSVLGLREHEAPEDQRGISAAERGKRVHEILEIFGKKSEDAGLLPWRPEQTARHRELLEESIHEVIERVLRVVPEGQRSLWEAERSRYNGLLRRWLAGETQAAQDPDWKPTAFEWDFEGHHVELGDGPLWFRGRADRVDVATSQGGTKAVRIVDYKSGSAGNTKDEATGGGRNLQLYLYGLAASRHFGAATAMGTYDFVLNGASRSWSGRCDLRKPTKSGPKETDHTALRQISALVHGMESGHFVPLPRKNGKFDGEGCKYCAVAEACGPWRRTAMDARKDSDDVGMALVAALDEPDTPGQLPGTQQVEGASK